jgi:hypothetical protein
LLAELKTEGETKMKPNENDLQQPSFWQLVFLQSKVNGARYDGETLSNQSWDWPKNTYLQRRLREVRWKPSFEASQMN